MSLATASETDLRMELWTSFLSLLRSYFALHNVMGSIPLQDAGPEGMPVIKGWLSRSPSTGRIWHIAVSYSAKTGNGGWQIFNISNIGGRSEKTFLDRKRFALNLDGTVSRDGSGEDVDMDHAAIDMVAYFMDKVKGDCLEVPA